MNMIPAVEKQSIQEHEPPTSLGGGFYYLLPISNPDDDTLLSEWGMHQRDRELRSLYRNQYAWLAQSAVASLTRRFTQTPWQLKGGRNLTTYFQEVLQEADFGDGWSQFWSRVLLDYLTCDYGAYIEIIGGGKSDRPLRGRVLGIAHLDSLRCIPTGNLEFPVVYWSRRTGTLHRIHYTRIHRLIDMPDGDESRFGAGLCALSRAISILQQQLGLMKYIAGQLSDMPPNGLMLLDGMSPDNYYTAYRDYKMRRETQGYKGYAAMGNASGTKIAAELIPFAVAPEGFDYDVYTDIAVNAFAAAFGIDRQDIFPLQGKMSGTATQSEVLAAKATGMAFGSLLSTTKRFINTKVLPPSLEFDYEYRDEEKDKLVADRTTVLLNNGTALRGLGVPDETILRYLAQQDETLRDVLMDEDGEVIALPDDDVESTEQTQPDDEMVETDNGNQVDPDASMEDSEKALGQRPAYGYVPLGFHDQVIAIQRALRDTIDPENVTEWQAVPTLHVTLAYAENIPDSAYEEMAKLMTLNHAIEIESHHLNVFDTPDGFALHIELEVTESLKAIQQKIYGIFELYGEGISEFSQPDNYNPHITLAYLKRNEGWQELSDLAEIYLKAHSVTIGRDDYDPVITAYSTQFSKSQKDITDTQADFMERFKAVLDEHRAGNINRRRAGILFRGMIRTFGGRAYGDGLEIGGVSREELSDSDSEEISRLVMEQSAFVSNLTDTLTNGDGISDAQAEQKALMWYNKSINPFFDAGRLSADKNGMYEFVYGDTIHCKDCKYLNGQIHRLKAFLDSGWFPKSSKLACWGGFCECELIKRPGAKAVGRLKKEYTPHQHIHKAA